MAKTGLGTPIVQSPRGTFEGYKYRSGMGLVECAEFFVRHDDFFGAVATNVPAGWAAAIIDTGGTVTTYATATTGANGVLQLTDATASEGAAFYGAKAVQLISGKKFFMEARILTDDVTDNAFQFGLADLSAVTNPEDLFTTASANLITAGILDGSATLTMLSDKANSGSTAESSTHANGTLSASTWATLAIAYDGGSELTLWKDGEKVLTWAQAFASTVPTATALAPFVGHINGNGAGGNLCLVDYVRIVAER